MIFHFLSDSGLSSATTTTTATASTVADEELNEVGDEDEAYYVNPAYQPDEDEGGAAVNPERKFAVIRVTPASTDSNQGESAKPVYTFEL